MSLTQKAVPMLSSMSNHVYQTLAPCHNLAKWLSHYFILLSFLIWTYYTRKECGKVSHVNVTCHSHMSGCHMISVGK